MAGRLGYLAALVLVAFLVAARADGIDLTVPDHYVGAASRPNVQLPPVFRVWTAGWSNAAPCRFAA